MKPIFDAIKDLLIERGWQIDETAVENSMLELKEFIHPKTGKRIHIFDAMKAQEDLEIEEEDKLNA